MDAILTHPGNLHKDRFARERNMIDFTLIRGDGILDDRFGPVHSNLLNDTYLTFGNNKDGVCVLGDRS